jgi:hypothetical protein
MCNHIKDQGHVAYMGERNNTYRILVGKAKGKRQLGQCMHIWQNNIKIDLKETVWENKVCINLPQERNQWQALVTVVMNLQVPWM